MTDILDKLYAATDAVRALDEEREPLDVVRARAGARAGERRPFRAALGLVVAGLAEDLRDGMEQARTAVANGAARGALDALRAESLKEIAT